MIFSPHQNESRNYANSTVNSPPSPQKGVSALSAIVTHPTAIVTYPIADVTHPFAGVSALSA
jgi:hypothetical protein